MVYRTKAFEAVERTATNAVYRVGRLLKEASEGRTPEADATVARLLDEYGAVGDRDQ